MQVPSVSVDQLLAEVTRQHAVVVPRERDQVLELPVCAVPETDRLERPSALAQEPERCKTSGP